VARTRKDIQKNVSGPTQGLTEFKHCKALQLPNDRKSWKTACTLGLMPGSGNGPSWWWWCLFVTLIMQWLG